MKKLPFVLGFVVALVPARAFATPIIVPGLFPVAPFAGTVLDFEGQAEGTIITSQYAGVTFTQAGSGSPMIDNSPFLAAYVSLSGVGVLTGSGAGGQLPADAGIIGTFDSGVARAGAFFGDQLVLGVWSSAANVRPYRIATPKNSMNPSETTIVVTCRLRAAANRHPLEWKDRVRGHERSAAARSDPAYFHLSHPGRGRRFANPKS
jgi:hypothetical protein